MKVFVDSSVLIEFENGRNQELLTKLLEKPALNLCLNSVVASEYFYKLLGILAGKSPMSVCESGKIDEVLLEHDTQLFLTYFPCSTHPKKQLF